MKLVSIETAVTPGSLAAIENVPGAPPKVVAVDLPSDQRTARSLAPAIKELLAKASWQTTDIDAVAVTTGPGSFTGLRLGVTAAKTLAYAAEAVCVPINTLAVLAAQAGDASGSAVLDAQRGELFVGAFDAGKLSGELSILSEAAWLEQLKPGDVAIGPVLSRLAERLPESVTAAPESGWRPLAETVAGLAITAVEAGQTVSPFELLPNYYRLSAAEEKLGAGE